jgi:hypothetical protein
MGNLKFIFFFTISHITAYTVAGLIALNISDDIYKSRNRLCDFLRDMEDKSESRHVQKFVFPAQIIRGVLMAVILLPFLNTILIFSFLEKIIFFSGLMFVYTHFSAVSPFIDNIEGFVYFKNKYLEKKAFLKFQLEMIIYSILFGFLLSSIYLIF